MGQLSFSLSRLIAGGIRGFDAGRGFAKRFFRLRERRGAGERWRQLNPAQLPPRARGGQKILHFVQSRSLTRELTVIRLALIVSLVAALSPAASAQVKITIDHNAGATANREFKFQQVTAPSRDDLGVQARIVLIDGRLDPNGGDLNALIDGRLPADEDEPGANLFFNAGSFGGRIRMDWNTPAEIVQVNTYSWHSDTRAPQLYKLYGSDGAARNFDGAPKRGIDPSTCGWKLIATVSTLPDRGEEGGQYAVQITGAGGALGRYRYLLFDIYPGEIIDNWGNTFYSEIDVITGKRQQKFVD